jgi:phenylalanyl-tRNA synthetase beta chain
MLFLRSWLEEYIDLSGYTNKELADIITTKSSEVEEIKVISDYFEGKVVVGQIKNVRNHPDADRLRCFDVMIGEGKSVKIVSAAPNVEEDLLVPVALEGAKLPNGMTIVPRKMRGEESQGMCCGCSELMLETEPSAGLWELGPEFGRAEKPVILGQSICEAFSDYFPQEVVFDIKVLPNRIGVFGSYLGMALEIAFCLENKGLLKRKASRILDPEIFLDDVRNQFTFKPNKTDRNKVSFKDDTGYTKSFSLFDVTFTPQTDYYLPHELQKRMYLTGINMIGGLADVSNYLLYDVGQPTHFFSKAKVADLMVNNNINWQIKSLDKEVKFEGLGQLKNGIIPKGVNVLLDEKDNVLAIPGISGGKSTSLDEDEKEFILEIANFEAEDVARSSFALKYRSDGSKVWSGSVNQELLFVTLLHFQELLGENIEVSPILFWSAMTGRVENIDEFLVQRERSRIAIDMGYLADRLDGRGVAYWQPILEQKLQLLGNYENGTLVTEAFYSNLQSLQDVLEELIRVVGFENLEPQHLTLSSSTKQDKSFERLLLIKEVLTQFGFDEVMTRPFVGENKLSDIDAAPKVIKPYRSTEPYLRDNLLYSLVEILSNNVKEGYKEPRIFELNSVFSQVAGLVKESKELEAVFVAEDPYVATSLAHELWKKTSRKPIQEYKAIADLSDKVGKGVYIETNQQNDTWISIKEISNSLKKQFDLPLNKKVWSINMVLENWDQTIFPYKSYKDESEYPNIKRSYNLSLGTANTWKQIDESLHLIDVDGIDISVWPVDRISIDGKMVMTISIQFVSYQRTLTSEDIAGYEVLMKLKLDEIGVVLK